MHYTMAAASLVWRNVSDFCHTPLVWNLREELKHTQQKNPARQFKVMYVTLYLVNILQRLVELLHIRRRPPQIGNVFGILKNLLQYPDMLGASETDTLKSHVAAHQ